MRLKLKSLEFGCVEYGQGVTRVPPGFSRLCVAVHNSPGSRPALEAQRKPRLSEAESGVLPILPPEKRKENGHPLRKGPGALPNFPAQPPRACCGPGCLRTEGRA